jgi:hypothetical protein
MKYVKDILLLSASLTCGLYLLVLSITGIIRGRVYYEPNCAPLELRVKPIRFVLLCTLLFCIGIGFLTFAAKVGATIFNTL